ncbi:type IV pilin protein [Paracidovorax anthurii]|uniref:Type IV pilus assembly protein PilE n=1 Tax=Paracidovorax anthurii TaxID=78229 RepID=A0A328Z782_9BURK|nr:type IV pilin protein [Paracidovorax anthurii]RAR81055.1 type IV pilus assembly protein PilE [Paracidovorax anthurii]
MTHSKHSNGFSLIELMIVVAIIGLLAAVAYPAYTDSILKGRRAQGRTALMELMQQQERYMTQNNCYLKFTNTTGTVSATTCTGGTSSTVPFKVFSGDTNSGTAYWLSARECTAGSTTLDMKTCVMVEATPTKSDPNAGVLSLTSFGQKSCSGSKPQVCWP